LPILTMAPLLSDQLGEIMRRVQDHFSTAPAAPQWLGSVPFLGSKLFSLWDALVAAGGDLGAVVHPYSSTIEQMLLTAARALADSVVQAILSLIVATMLWSGGTAIVQELRDVLRRLGGRTAEESLFVATGAVRSVAYGVIGTATLQAFLLALGLGLAGVPGAVTLGFVGFVLATSQIGAPFLALIWGGAAWWLFANDQFGLGCLMIGWGVLVSLVDNILKPWLIGLGVRMPISLTILGVFGGFVAFGFLGLFIGPTLIAVTFVLLQSWRSAAERVS
jgi:predicted PurR-regulated permease PerM